MNKYKKSGDTEYFGLLYDRYIPLVYGICLKYLQNGDKAQDAVMQIFEDLLLKISGYEIQVFKAWLHSVVRNYCFQVIRKENKEIIIDFNSQIMESDHVLHLLCEEESNEDALKALGRCMKRLPEPQRISITHFFMNEMSYADIVEKTGYTLNNVKSHIQNGKRNLKICISKHSK